MISSKTPQMTINRLAAALRSRDIDAAVALYEEGATAVVGPGLLAKGEPSIRRLFEGVFSLDTEMRYEVKHMVEAGDIALFTGMLSIAGGPEVIPVPRRNAQAIILRKQPDGNWLIAVDNAFGSVGAA
jgi:ketosteroid isomerase-like protein